MSSLSSEQQEPLDDMIRCGFMSIGQAFYEAEQGIAKMVRELEQES